MPDEQVSPAPENAPKKKGWLPVVLALGLGAAGIFFWLRPQTAPILLCATPARFHLRRLLEPFLPNVVVLSPLEIPPTVSVQSLGTVR